MRDNRLGTRRHEDCDLQRMLGSALAEEAEADQLTAAPSTIAAELAVIMDPQAQQQVHQPLSPPDSDLETERPVPPDVMGQNCSIFIVDIAGFSSPTRTDADRDCIRTVMYDLMDQAFTAAGLDLVRLYQEDRGDGALVIVPPTTPTTQVVGPMLAHLAAGLRRHNRRADDATRLQLRVALDVGPVHHDPQDGVHGFAIIRTARMLNARVVKQRVAETGADLAFITSDFVYDSVITPAPGLVDPSRYSRVQVQVKETSLSAWLALEGGVSRLSTL
ncbi:hypothetical protein SAMN05443665_104558 [Actinomadura meyerae]|uniref:Guanylate cyclase domain-containing protein n=1 Tax=Actinomadura meyerae TaxID=240840 RepID=A0A239NNX4_9ACTN|nr:hypothetical protein [Actinomadura meyerae]SNT56611.1 hypothetical protein SAMN05443665_104558 [Actinomadura meyerae]